MTTQNDLFDVDVDVPPRDAWVAAATAALKGRDPDTLVTTSPDGIDVSPLYTVDDAPALDVGLPGSAPFVRGATTSGALVAGFDLRQAHVLDDVATVNAEILDDLEGGATSIRLGLVRAPSVDELDDALAGVLLDLAPVALDPGPWFQQAGASLAELLARRELDPATTSGAIGADPIGALARHGALATDLPAAMGHLGELADRFAGWPRVTVARADGSVWADAGATPATEVGLTLATAVASLRALSAGGLSPSAAASRVEIVLTADVDQFTTIAKLRAARRCWARVLVASGVDPGEVTPSIQAVTAASNLSRVDPWVNLLRTTVATFAAMAGGATSITVRPFDSAVGRHSELGRRLARNIAHLLSAESGLANVVDPAGGSSYVESLTEALAQRSWDRLGEIDGTGGVADAVTTGRVAEMLADQWAETRAQLATRRRALTGVSEFPVVDEEPLERAPAPVVDVPSGGATVEPLRLRRLAEPFEELRATADAHADRTGTRPAVFLANLGPVSAHTARATFATNLFAVGGIVALDGGGSDDAALAAAWRDSGAPGAVICSSDEVYRQRAVSAAAALHDAGCDAIWLAGRPGDDEASLRAAGVVGFVHLGCDVVSVLADAHERLGVRR